MAGSTTDTVKWTLSGGGVIVNIIAVMNADGSVTLTYALDENSVQADLNGIFIDFGNDGGALTSVGSKANNMNGSDTDGDKLDGFDMAQALGSVGGNDADRTSGSWTISAEDLAKWGVTSLEQLAEAEIGIRATSVGDDREGSVKLADTGTFCPGEEEQDDFPLWGQDISNVIFVFKQDDGDGKPKPDGDGYYTVKIDNWPNAADDDLDNSIDDILAYLIAEDSFISSDANLLGVIIKGGIQDTNFYAYGANNTNGILPDEAPEGLALSWDGSSNPQPANAVDQSYNYGDIFV